MSDNNFNRTLRATWSHEPVFNGLQPFNLWVRGLCWTYCEADGWKIRGDSGLLEVYHDDGDETLVNEDIPADDGTTPWWVIVPYISVTLTDPPEEALVNVSASQVQDSFDPATDDEFEGVIDWVANAAV